MVELYDETSRAFIRFAHFSIALSMYGRACLILLAYFAPDSCIVHFDIIDIIRSRLALALYKYFFSNSHCFIASLSGRPTRAKRVLGPDIKIVNSGPRKASIAADTIADAFARSCEATVAATEYAAETISACAVSTIAPAIEFATETFPYFISFLDFITFDIAALISAIVFKIVAYVA